MSYGVRRNRHAVLLLRTLIHLVGADVSRRDAKLLVMPDLNRVDDLIDTRRDRCYQPLVLRESLQSVHGCKTGKKEASIVNYFNNLCRYIRFSRECFRLARTRRRCLSAQIPYSLRVCFVQDKIYFRNESSATEIFLVIRAEC